MDILRNLKHENIVELQQVIAPRDCELWFIYEFVEQDLFKFISMHGRKGKVIELKIIKKVARELLQALEATHSIGVMHRDVKPHNVLIDSKTSTAKLCD